MSAAMTFRRLPFLPLLGLLLVVLTVISAVYFTRSQAAANDWVNHTLDVEVKIGEISSATEALQSAHRGYVITADPAMLVDLDDNAAALTRLIAELRTLTGDNPDRQREIRQLSQLAYAKVAFARNIVVLAGEGHRDDAIARTRDGEGRRLMSSIQQLLDQMKDQEDALLRERTERADRVLRALATGQVAAILLTLLVAALTIRDARVRFRLMEEARDEARGAADLAREEMAAREVAEGQLRQVQKMESIGQLTGGIAHDFNNMLAIVIGSLELARRRARSGDMQKLERCIDNAVEGAERAAALTARLLAFSRQQPLAPKPIDANRLVSNMSELLRRTLGELIEVETVLAGGLWSTYADFSQLENAILNLAVNARDAMQGGGRLTIETGNAHLDDDYARTRTDVAPGQYVMIGVSDTGEGMPPDVIARAFDPFFTTKAAGRGTGLGLSQVFGFIKQSGGHVALYSEPGEGTTVKLYLPRFNGAGTDIPTAAAAQDVPPEGKPDEIVLVVEDEQRVRHFSVDALRELGYTAISASSGREALAILAEQPRIALLFTDVVMPEMNGRRLADEARSLSAELKILYTTGYTKNAVVHNGMLDAGVAFLAKPFTISQLAWKVREVLDGGGINRPL